MVDPGGGPGGGGRREVTATSYRNFSSAGEGAPVRACYSQKTQEGQRFWNFTAFPVLKSVSRAS